MKDLMFDIDEQEVDCPVIKQGHRDNKDKLRWRNFPMFLMEPLVHVGAANEVREGNPKGKYPTYNFLKGLSVTDNMDSLMRHLNDFIDPTVSDIDPEDGCHMLAKVAWNALVALHFLETRPELDDRYKLPGEENASKD